MRFQLTSRSRSIEINIHHKNDAITFIPHLHKTIFVKMAPYQMLTDDIVAHTIDTAADRFEAATSSDGPKMAINPNGTKPGFKLRVPALTQTELASMFGAFEADFGDEEVNIPEFAYKAGEDQDIMTPDSSDGTGLDTDNQSDITSATTIDTPAPTTTGFSFDLGGSAKEINDRIAYQPLQAAIDAATDEKATTGVGFQFALTGAAKSIQERVTSPEDEKASESGHESNAAEKTEEKTERFTTGGKSLFAPYATFAGKHLPSEPVRTDDREDDEDEEMCDVSGSDYDSEASENDDRPSTSGKSLIHPPRAFGYKTPPSNLVHVGDGDSKTDDEMTKATESEDESSSSDEGNEEPATGRPSFGVKRPPSNVVRAGEDENESEEDVHSDIDASEESGQETEAEKPTTASKSVPSAHKTTCKSTSSKSVSGSNARAPSDKSAPATAGKSVANYFGHEQVSGSDTGDVSKTSASKSKPVKVDIGMSLQAIANYNTLILRKFRQLAEQKNDLLIKFLVKDIPKQRAHRAEHLHKLGQNLDEEQRAKECIWEDVIEINNKIQEHWNSSQSHNDKSLTSVYEQIDALDADRERMLASISEVDAPRTLLDFIPHAMRIVGKDVPAAPAPANATTTSAAVTNSEVDQHALDNAFAVQTSKEAEATTQSVGEQQNTTTCNEPADEMDVDDDLDSLFGDSLGGYAGGNDVAMVEQDSTEQMDVDDDLDSLFGDSNDGLAGDNTVAMVEQDSTEQMAIADSKETGSIPVASDDLDTSRTIEDGQIQDMTAQEQPKASTHEQPVALQACKRTQDDEDAAHSSAEHESPAPPTLSTEQQIEQTACSEAPVMFDEEPLADFPTPSEQPNAQDDCNEPLMWDDELAALLDFPSEQPYENSNLDELPVITDDDFEAFFAVSLEQMDEQNNCNEPLVMTEEDHDFADVLALGDILAAEDNNAQAAPLAPVEEQSLQQEKQIPVPPPAPAMAGSQQNQLWSQVPPSQQPIPQVGLAGTTTNTSAAHQQQVAQQVLQLAQRPQVQPPQQVFLMQDFSHAAQTQQAPRQQIPQVHQPQQPDALQPAAAIMPAQNTAKETQSRRRVSRKKKDDEASLAPMPPMDANEYKDYQQFSQEVNTESQAQPAAGTTSRKYLGESWTLINEQHSKTTPPNLRQVGCFDSMVQGFQVKQRQLSAEIKAAEEAERLKDTQPAQETEAPPQLQLPQQTQAPPIAQQSVHQNAQALPNTRSVQEPQMFQPAQVNHNNQFMGNHQALPIATQPQPQPQRPQQAFALENFSPGTAIMNIQAQFLATAPGNMADLPASTLAPAPPQTPQRAQPTHGHNHTPEITPATNDQDKTKGKGPGRPCKANADLASERRRHAKTLPDGPGYTQAPTPEQRAAKKAAKRMTRTQSSSSSASTASSSRGSSRRGGSSVEDVQYDAHPGARLGLGTSASDYIAQQAEKKPKRKTGTSRARKATQAIQQMPEPASSPLASLSRSSTPSPYRSIAPKSQTSQTNGYKAQSALDVQDMAVNNHGHMPMAPMQQPQHPIQQVALPPAPMTNSFDGMFQQRPVQHIQPAQQLMAPTPRPINNGVVDLTQAQFGQMQRQSMSQTPSIHNGGQGMSTAQKRKRGEPEQQEDTGRQKRQNTGTVAGAQSYQESPMPAQMHPQPQPQRMPMPNGGLGQNSPLRGLMQYSSSLHQQIAQNWQQMSQLDQLGQGNTDLYQCLVQQNMMLQGQVQQCMQQMSMANRNAISMQNSRTRVSDEANQFGSHVNRVGVNNMDYPSAFQGGYNNGPYMGNGGMN